MRVTGPVKRSFFVSCKFDVAAAIGAFTSTLLCAYYLIFWEGPFEKAMTSPFTFHSSISEGNCVILRSDANIRIFFICHTNTVCLFERTCNVRIAETMCLTAGQTWCLRATPRQCLMIALLLAQDLSALRVSYQRYWIKSMFVQRVWKKGTTITFPFNF